MFKRGFSICSLVQNYSPMRSVGPTDPPEYNWLYSIPAAVFTGGFLLAAQTGFAGLVQAGYLASSILCIGRRHVSHRSQYPQRISARFSHRTGLPIYRKTRKRPRHARRWLGFPYVLGRRWIPTSSPRAIRYVDCCRRGHWLDHWEEDYRNGASPDGRRSVIFFVGLTWAGNSPRYVFYSPALGCWSCCCPYLYRKRVGGRWPCFNASRMNIADSFLISCLSISVFSSSLLPTSVSSLVE